MNFVSFFKKWLKENRMEIHLTYNEGKPVVAERIIRPLQYKIYKHMTTVSKKCLSVYFDVLDDIVNKYNNSFHGTVKMKPIDAKSGSYAEYNVDSC